MHWLRLFLTALLLIISTSFARAADPAIKWETIETPHFRVIYDSRHREVGKLYATYAEQAFAATTPAFGIWPRKTTLLIDDSQDLANGMAAGLPYPNIITYPVLPTLLDSISDYGNWGLELLTHEYVHILTFEPATGIMRPLRWIFGSIIRPNGILPRWYLEGLAVELETRYSSFGRLRSANYLSIIRAMAEEGALRGEDISRINEASIPDWPGGIRPYLMGALLWNEIVRDGGDKMIGELNLHYSRRIPFFIDGPLESRLGIDYSGLLSKTYDRLENKVREQLERIRTAGLTQGQLVDQVGYFNHSPIISPNGRYMAFIARTQSEDSLIMLAERNSKNESFAKIKPKAVVDGNSTNRIAWFPGSKSFVYDSIDTFDRFYSYSDLYKFDLTTRRRTQLTRGLRAREPGVSPNGKWITFAQTVPASTQLSLVDADGKNFRVLYTPPVQTRVSRPEFLTNTEIIFSEKRDDGAEGFKVLTLKLDPHGMPIAAGEAYQVLKEFKPAHFPRRTRDGLLFVSSMTGVSNFYLANKDLSGARAITNVSTRALTGDIDFLTGDLVYSRVSARGPLIEVLPQNAWTKAEPPQVAPLVDNDWPHFEAPKPEVEIGEPEEYSALPYLLPRYWMPYVFFIPDGLYMQASTAASDPVGRHAYSITGAFDTLSKKPSVFGQYVNRQTRIPITLSGEDINEYIYSANIVRHSSSGALEGSFFVPGLNANWRSSLGIQALQTQFSGSSVSRAGGRVTLRYQNASQRGMQISPESGGNLMLGYTNYVPGLGTVDYDQVDASAAIYFSESTRFLSWLPERHAIALSTKASIAPRLTPLLLGRSTVGGNFQNGLIQNTFLMRGYSSGVFIGRNMITASAEYRFPITYTYSGFGTYPVFLQRWHGSVFVDAVTLDGVAYNAPQNTFARTWVGKTYFGTGVEVKADTTLFYQMPVQFIFGLYYGFDRSVNQTPILPFFGVGF